MNPLSTAKNLMSFAKNQLPVFQGKSSKNESMAFTFGDAVPVLNGNELSDYLECWFNGRWYEPQVSMNGLAKSFKSTPYLNSGIIFKRNFLANLFVPHSRLNRKAFEQVALDFIWCGNSYLEEIKSRLGNVIEYKPSLAKYYNNGSHAGFILYVNDAAQDPNDITALRQALKESKGPGNFRNLFYYAPGGKKDGIQILPVSEIAAKDDFTNIKSITRDDTLAALRIPPQLMGIVPNNTGGFGSIKDAAEVFYQNEIVPLQSRMQQINDWAGEEIIRFKEYKIQNIA